jgi:hypothetical protein
MMEALAVRLLVCGWALAFAAASVGMGSCIGGLKRVERAAGFVTVLGAVLFALGIALWFWAITAGVLDAGEGR